MLHLPLLIVPYLLAGVPEGRVTIWETELDWSGGLVHVMHVYEDVAGWPLEAESAIERIELRVDTSIEHYFEFTNVSSEPYAPTLQAGLYVGFFQPICCNNLTEDLGCEVSFGTIEPGAGLLGTMSCDVHVTLPLVESSVDLVPGYETWFLGGIISADYDCFDCGPYSWDGTRTDEGTLRLQYVYSADLDSNGVVGVGDLMIMLGAWSAPFGFEDLLFLLSAWDKPT